MTTQMNVPVPFDKDAFTCYQRGIYDDPAVDVYVNRQQDLAVLNPRPSVDYGDYLPRVKKLGLQEYKKKTAVYQRRLGKILPILAAGAGSLIEIGAGEGVFLGLLKEKLPAVALAAVEPDLNARPRLAAQLGSEVFVSAADAGRSGRKFDVVCLFHVLEHILCPAAFLRDLSGLMHGSSMLIAEVPSLSDPLISLYGSEKYKKYYFQKQHPYVYSPASLERLMQYHGFDTLQVINYQRYGLENHLTWLAQGTPGGNAVYAAIFAKSGDQYVAELEQSGRTDTVIWAGKKR